MTKIGSPTASRVALAPDDTLSPLLAEVGARSLTRGLFFDIAQIASDATVINTRADRNLVAISVASHLQGAAR